MEVFARGLFRGISQTLRTSRHLREHAIRAVSHDIGQREAPRFPMLVIVLGKSPITPEEGKDDANTRT